MSYRRGVVSSALSSPVSPIITSTSMPTPVESILTSTPLPNIQTTTVISTASPTPTPAAVSTMTSQIPVVVSSSVPKSSVSVASVILSQTVSPSPITTQALPTSSPTVSKPSSIWTSAYSSSTPNPPETIFTTFPVPSASPIALASPPQEYTSNSSTKPHQPTIYGWILPSLLLFIVVAATITFTARYRQMKKKEKLQCLKDADMEKAAESLSCNTPAKKVSLIERKNRLEENQTSFGQMSHITHFQPHERLELPKGVVDSTRVGISGERRNSILPPLMWQPKKSLHQMGAGFQENNVIGAIPYKIHQRGDTLGFF
ncbi:hypothetical protein O181_005660 [Austropuccinia psidii MF-1]|uniref:Uncharacterized protein n=1 Tax=Austropuccinia psidii MF-1 TaxID=1389203 RepID=A0A9Q3BJE4_9BASI|nr:hypothetical protein [Austropuccinia psidii MF-1]